MTEKWGAEEDEGRQEKFIRHAQNYEYMVNKILRNEYLQNMNEYRTDKME